MRRLCRQGAHPERLEGRQGVPVLHGNHQEDGRSGADGAERGCWSGRGGHGLHGVRNSDGGDFEGLRHCWGDRQCS